MKKLLQKCACVALAAQLCGAGMALATDSPSGRPMALGKPATLSANGDLHDFTGYVVDSVGFIKLRDVAMAMQGSTAQFAIAWDATTQQVAITTGEAYTPVGGELEATDAGNQFYRTSPAQISVDGETVDLDVYEIEGNNYVRLKQLAPLVGFTLGLDEETEVLLLDALVD